MLSGMGKVKKVACVATTINVVIVTDVTKPDDVRN